MGLTDSGKPNQKLDYAWPESKRLRYVVEAPISKWNDTPGRTAEEVAQAMEAAARMKE